MMGIIILINASRRCKLYVVDKTYKKINSKKIIHTKNTFRFLKSLLKLKEINLIQKLLQ